MNDPSIFFSYFSFVYFYFSESGGHLKEKKCSVSPVGGITIIQCRSSFLLT